MEIYIYMTIIIRKSVISFLLIYQKNTYKKEFQFMSRISFKSWSYTFKTSLEIVQRGTRHLGKHVLGFFWKYPIL